MSKILRNLLRITLFVDFLISLGFGIVSWFSPEGTFGTLISNSQMNESLILSLLSSLSIFYILIGLVCFAGFMASFPFNSWIGAIMILRHGWIGIAGIIGLGAKKEWLEGSPYPDIIIHLVFVFAYILGIYYVHRAYKSTSLKEGKD